MSAPLPAGAATASPAVHGGEAGAAPPTATQVERAKAVWRGLATASLTALGVGAALLSPTTKERVLAPSTRGRAGHPRPSAMLSSLPRTRQYTRLHCAQRCSDSGARRRYCAHRPLAVVDRHPLRRSGEKVA